MLPWPVLRDFLSNLPPTGDSAVFRAQHPQSWWWTPELDFLGAVLTAVQWGNWQRAGGKGDKPKPIKRPKEKPRKRVETTITADELKTRRQALNERVTGKVDDGGH